MDLTITKSVMCEITDYQTFKETLGAELIGSRASYTQTAPGKEYLWITPDGQTWVDSDWIRHNKILNKLKED